MRSIRIPGFAKCRYYLSELEQRIYDGHQRHDPDVAKQYLDALRGRAYLALHDAQTSQGAPQGLLEPDLDAAGRARRYHLRLRIAQGLESWTELLNLNGIAGNTSKANTTTT